jgi:phage regulator Rha-like protein
MTDTTPQKNAPRACDTEGLHDDTNRCDFPIKNTAVAEPQDLALTTTTAEPRVSTQDLAKHLGNKHRSLFELVQNHRADFEQLGILRFQTGVIDGRGQPEKFAMLNEDQATLALAYSKNTKQVRELKVKLVKAFGLARRAADLRKTEYLPQYHQLHDAMHVLANGSPNERFFHANVNKLLNKFAGIEAGQRASAALPHQAMLIVGQLVASNATQGAADHHDGYQRIKANLQALGAVAQLGVAQHG